MTNGVTFLPKVDKIIVFKDGVISEMGTYDELLNHQGAFAEYITTYLQETEGDSETDSESKIYITNCYQTSG